MKASKINSGRQRGLTAAGLAVFVLFIIWGHFEAAEAGQTSPEVRSLLEEKGKVPWLERDLGYGLVTLDDGTMLRENFDLLDDYEARTNFKTYDFKPLFQEGYDEQDNKSNALSRALEQYLKSEIPYSFRALAGLDKVDVVNLVEGGHEAYVFIIIRSEPDFIKTNRSAGTFYYDVVSVMKGLEKFILLHREMDEVIWLSRESSSFFMFVIQKKMQ